MRIHSPVKRLEYLRIYIGGNFRIRIQIQYIWIHHNTSAPHGESLVIFNRQVSSGYTVPVTEIFTDLLEGGGSGPMAGGPWPLPPERCRLPGVSAARRHTLGPAEHPLPILPTSPPFPPGFNFKVRRWPRSLVHLSYVFFCLYLKII